MTEDDFQASLAESAPPPGLDGALVALWWDRRGDWDRAHATVQDDKSARAAWVHALLHRIEGDSGNARYWYARAGQKPAEGDLDLERRHILAALLEV